MQLQVKMLLEQLLMRQLEQSNYRLKYMYWYMAPSSLLFFLINL